MKTFFLTLLIVLFFVTSISAQCGYGVKAGINISNHKTTGEGINVDTSPLVGFHIGGYGHYFILEPLAVQGELLFSQKGSKWDDPYFSGKDRTNYIDIPVLVRYQILEYLNVHAGPQLGILVSAKQIPDDGDKEDIKDYYKGTDFSLVFGAEGNLPHNINVTIRYILGLSTINTDAEYWEEWRNTVWQISIGYRLKQREK
jgi:hypothetical protein